MQAQMIHNDDPTIDGVLRPISLARKVLRDYDAHRYTVVGRTGDDPPGVASIGRAADAVREALATTATEETVTVLVHEMLGGLNVSKVVVGNLIASVVGDRCLPVVAAAMAAAKFRGQKVGAEQFLRECTRSRQSIEWLLEGLIDASAAMRRRQGYWYHQNGGRGAF